ncbi:hypothetical protein OL239_12000 [Arthrobacter sp. ATA002]|uniref:hypothetical protein n=1 Tax=Arthrobacter sp. ATA002 TaxID=2991715 RepID=UPI0022A7C7F0|nr:hypothetical protein [Arthrobacter sp. ATA002]WAP50740.1 hypothetical protein OL239_12000 [Arthrobacter sp. ATA002]
MDERIEHALAITPSSSAAARTVEITTIGAKTGRKRRIEIWFYRVHDKIYLTTQPLHRAYISQRVQPIEEWMTGSPLMHVTFQQG